MVCVPPPPSDRYIPPVPSGTSRYGKPCFTVLLLVLLKSIASGPYFHTVSTAGEDFWSKIYCLRREWKGGGIWCLEFDGRCGWSNRQNFFFQIVQTSNYAKSFCGSFSKEKSPRYRVLHWRIKKDTTGSRVLVSLTWGDLNHCNFCCRWEQNDGTCFISLNIMACTCQLLPVLPSGSMQCLG